MDINKIEMILCALEMGSFSKAAEKYSYTPSALTHIADSLESEIGTEFIRRTHSGIEVSDPEIVKGLQSICDTKKYICSLARKNSHLTVGTYSSTSKYILPKVIKAFHDKHPEITVDVIVVSALSQLLNTDTDVLFGVEQFSDDYIWTPIMTDPYVAVFPQGHTSAAEFSFDKRYSEIYIMSDEIIIAKKINKDNFDGVTLVNAHDDSSIIQMIKAQMGISVLPALSVTESDGLTILPVTPPLSRTLGVSAKKNSPKSGMIKEFTKLFMSV